MRMGGMGDASKEPGTSFRRKMIFLAVVLVLGLAYLLRGVLVPLFLAFLLAYALDPFVDRLTQGKPHETPRTFLFGTIGYVGVALAALIVPVFALYLLIDFDRIVTRVEQLVPRRWVDPVSDVARQIHRTLSGYVRGQLTA